MGTSGSTTDAPMFHLPVVSLAAEHLVMGHLLRRNVLTYKAPPDNEGYDLICIHPDPSASGWFACGEEVQTWFWCHGQGSERLNRA